MLWALIEIGSLAFYIILAIFTLIQVLIIGASDGFSRPFKGCSFLTAIFLLLLIGFGTYNGEGLTFALIFENLALFAVYAGYYLGIGVFWTVFRWWRESRSLLHDHMDHRARWLKDSYGIDSNAMPSRDSSFGHIPREWIAMHVTALTSKRLKDSFILSLEGDNCKDSNGFLRLNKAAVEQYIAAHHDQYLAYLDEQIGPYWKQKMIPKPSVSWFVGTMTFWPFSAIEYLFNDLIESIGRFCHRSLKKVIEAITNFVWSSAIDDLE